MRTNGQGRRTVHGMPGRPPTAAFVARPTSNLLRAFAGWALSRTHRPQDNTRDLYGT